MNPSLCKNFVNCFAPSGSPLIGFNSETNEVIPWFSNGFGPGITPPLNWSYRLTSAYATGTSTVSLAAAQASAVTTATTLAESTWAGRVDPVFTQIGESFTPTIETLTVSPYDLSNVEPIL